jgi:hypothetical protein
MWINWSATSILNRVLIRSSRELRIAVWAANSVVGGVDTESSHVDGVEGLAGVDDAGVPPFAD